MPEVTLLYAAFAVVALWLLGELLLQRRAPLHWRALALVGFLALVAGVVQGVLPLIGVGVLAFGAGQALATRAVKRSGAASHWTLVAPERVPVLGRLFAGEEPAPAAKGRARGAAPERVAVTEPPAGPGFLPQTEAVETAGAVEATAVFQADEYAVEGDSVYYAQPGQQVSYDSYDHSSYDHSAQPYEQQYQDHQQYQQYQEYAPYQQQAEYQPYPEPYPEYQQQYAGYEQQSYDQQPYDPQYSQQQYAQYPSHGAYEQPQAGYEGYGYEHAPQG